MYVNTQLDHRIFVAGPFKSLVAQSTGVMGVDDRARFERLIDRLELSGYIVHNAHRREGWGSAFLTAEECTRLDFDEISGCDVFVAFPGAPASPGTHVEIGWASALQKPMILLLDEGRDYAFLVNGLHAVADVIYLTVAAGENVSQRVETTVEHVLSGTHRSEL